jgi:hypothetical protein
VAARLRMELDAFTEDKVHDSIKGHESSLEKLSVMKGDAHTIGKHESRNRAKERHRGSRSRKELSGSSAMRHCGRNAIRGERSGVWGRCAAMQWGVAAREEDKCLEESRQPLRGLRRGSSHLHGLWRGCSPLAAPCDGTAPPPLRNGASAPPAPTLPCGSEAFFSSTDDSIFFHNSGALVPHTGTFAAPCAACAPAGRSQAGLATAAAMSDRRGWSTGKREGRRWSTVEVAEVGDGRHDPRVVERRPTANEAGVGRGRLE